ncbi:MAG: DUF481 domain-containing protein [Pseudomonadales bacterium]|nr:DUF481 domain-containing protein [Pseudomonadales bacterium]
MLLKSKSVQATLHCFVASSLILSAAAVGAQETESQSKTKVLQFDNGDQLTGVPLSDDAQGNIRFQTKELGIVVVSKDKAKVIDKPVPPKPHVSKLREWLSIPSELTGSFSVGITNSSGQSDYSSQTYIAEATWTDQDFVVSTFNQIKDDEASGQTLADRKSSDNYFRYHFNDRFFALAGLRYAQDDVLLVDEEYEIFAAPGVYLFREPDCQMNVALGAEYLYQEFSATAIAAGSEADSEGARYAAYEGFECSFLQAAKITQNVVYTMDVDNSDDYRYRASLGLLVPLLYDFSLSFTYNISYDNEPSFGVDNKQADMIVSVGYKF